jgi:ankyrin repeat protein
MVDIICVPCLLRLLVARADVDANSKDTNEQTPLSWAAVNGHEAVVRLLLDRADVEVNSRVGDGLTPLSRAARYGHEAVVGCWRTGPTSRRIRKMNLVGIWILVIVLSYEKATY